MRGGVRRGLFSIALCRGEGSLTPVDQKTARSNDGELSSNLFALIRCRCCNLLRRHHFPGDLVLRRLLLLATFFTSPAFANVITDRPFPLSHCYHWIQSRFLDLKYQHAQANSGELLFGESFRTNSAVAGLGLYCAKSPSQSADYGDRVIRVDFVEDVVILDDVSKKKYCGFLGKALPDEECQRKDWDIRLYQRNPDWYVIKNAAAIAKWSVASPELLSDLQAEVNATLSFSPKAQVVSSAINADIKAKGEIVFFNGKARMSLADLLAKDPEQVQTLPPTPVLIALSSLRPGLVSDERLAWATNTSVQRILEGRENAWRPLQALVKKDPGLRGKFADLVNQRVSLGTSLFPNLEVMMGLADAGELSDEAVQQIIELVMKNPGAVKWNDVTLTAESPLAKRLEPPLAEWITRGNPLERIAEILPLYRFALEQITTASLKTRIRQTVESAFPSVTESIIVLQFSAGSLGLGSSAKTMVGLCQAQIMLNNLYDRNLVLRLDNQRALHLGAVPQGGDSKAFCEASEGLVTQYLDLKNKGEKNILIVVGRIGDLPFQSAVDGPDALLAAAANFVQKNPRPSYGRTMTLSILGGEVSRNESSTPWQASDLPTAMVAFGKIIGIRTVAEKEQETRVSQSTKDFKITALFYGDKGFLAKIPFAVDVQEDFQTECIAAAKIHNLREVRRVALELTGSRIADRAIEGSTVPELCAKLGTLASMDIPTAATKARTDKLKKYNNIFQIQMPEVGLMILGADSIDDLKSSCSSEIKKMDFRPLESLNLRWNRMRPSMISANNGSWKTREAVCNAIVNSLEFSLPSSAQLKIQRRTAKFRIEVRFGRQQRTFIVNDKKELRSQCAALVTDEKSDSIKWDGDIYGSVYRDNGYWTTADQLCSAFIKKIDLK